MGFWNDVLKRGSVDEIADFLDGHALLNQLEEEDGVTDFLEVAEDVDLEVGILRDGLQVSRVVGHYA